MPLAVFLCQVALAQPNPADLSAAWNGHLEAIATHSPAPVLLSEEDFRVVSEGGIAKRRLVQEGPDRAIGVGWTPHPREAVWVAIIDDIHNTMVSDLTEHRLGQTPSGAKLLYQRLDLPWPFNDRQWTIEIRSDRAVADHTSNQVWSRSWTLSPNKAPQVATEDALWAPTLDGGWLVIDAAGGTLVVYQARTTIGGVVPDDVVTRWALSTLDEMMGNLFKRAAEIPSHYDASHESILGGDGQPITPF